MNAMDIALERGADFVQISNVRSEITELALRGTSFEFNHNSTSINCVRLLYNGVWGIASSNRENPENLVDLAIKQAKSIKSEGIELAEAKMAEGVFNFKQEVDDEEIKEIIRDLYNTIPGFSEIVFVKEVIARRIQNSDGADAVETKSLLSLSISTFAGNSVVSAEVGGIDSKLIENNAENIVENTLSRIRGVSNARILNPLMRGIKLPVILTKEAACAYVHEMVHNLEADVVIERGESLYGKSDELTVYDDPSYAGFGFYAFDDEGVLSRRKTLIKDGEVDNYLHTRFTARVFGDEPKGNGRGLYTFPKAFMSNVIVKKGSWTLEEMISETREGFIVEGLVEGKTHKNYVVIFPELAWYIRNGEVRHPAKVESVKIPLNLSLVVGVGKEYFERIAYEKSFALAEVSPPILIEKASLN